MPKLFAGGAYVHNTALDDEEPRHAQSINLHCLEPDSAGYTLKEGRRLWWCDGPVADHAVGRYFDVLDTLVDLANGADDWLLIAR